MRAAAAVLLVVLAGCSGAASLGTETATVTPAPVPSPTQQTPPDTLPPGVTGDGVVDVASLVQAHQRALTNRSYTWRARRTTAGPGADEMTVTDIRTVAHVQNESTYDYWTNHRFVWRNGRQRTFGNYTEFAAPDGRYVRYRDTEADREYRRIERTPARARVGRIAMAALDQYLPTANATLAVARHDGRRYYELRGEGTDAVVTPQGVSNYTVRALLRPDGFVRSLSVSYRTVTNGRQRTVRYRFVYESLGTTAVERPDWVSDRWRPNGTATPTRRVEHTGAPP